MVKLHENIVGIDAAIFMHPKTWEASGHVSAFNDPLIDNKDSKKRYRADVLIEAGWPNRMKRSKKRSRRPASVSASRSTRPNTAKRRRAWRRPRPNATRCTSVSPMR